VGYSILKRSSKSRRQSETLQRCNASQIWSKDAKRTAFIESQGWRVIIVWERDWKRSKQEIIDRIIEKEKQ
jgi:very-short-patch-repair endonuclease